MFRRRLLTINEKFRIFVEDLLHGNTINTLDTYLLYKNILFVTKFAHSPSLEDYQFLPEVSLSDPLSLLLLLQCSQGFIHHYGHGLQKLLDIKRY